MYDRKINLIETFTEKEKRIYTLLCANLNNQEIAMEIDCSEVWIRKQLSVVYRKLGLISTSHHDRRKMRQTAISYGGTRIEQVVSVQASGGYSEKMIRLAAMRLIECGLHDKRIVNGVVADLLLVLDKKI